MALADDEAGTELLAVDVGPLSDGDPLPDGGLVVDCGPVVADGAIARDCAAAVFACVVTEASARAGLVERWPGSSAATVTSASTGTA